MKNDDRTLDDLRELRVVVHPTSSNPERHKTETMRRIHDEAARAARSRWRYLLGGGGLCLIAGLSYATGLVQAISEWVVTVEPIDQETDRVTLEHTADPELDFTVDVPNTETQELVDAAENNELFVLEVVEEDPPQGTTSLVVRPVETLAADGSSKSNEIPRD